jgi:beta-glucosidase
MRVLCFLFLCLAACSSPPTSLIGAACQPNLAAAGEAWALTASSQLAATGSGLCATAALPVADGSLVTMAPCAAGPAPAQQWAYNASGANSTGSLVLAAFPTHCLNLAGYGTSPGTAAWLYTCTSSGCEHGNCEWVGPAPGSGGGGSLVNPASGLCLQDGSALPPLPHTCQLGSPAAGLPFCDPQLPLQQRLDDLLARLSVAQKVQQWAVPLSWFGYQPGLNLKGMHWDHTGIHGMTYPGGIANAPPLTVSVFPHAIAQAASFDTALAARLASATALEGRAVNALVYASSGGTLWAGVSFDGGPLANTATHPAWGRISECYGECPVLAAAMGVSATLALQNRSADGRWLLSSSVTRHWLGFHGANDLPGDGQESIGLHAFADQQELPYRSLQVQGGAEGIMCANSAFAIGNRSAGAALIPSCVHPFLLAKLQEWGYEGNTQTDCCDALTSAVDNHHYFPNYKEAAIAFITAGVNGYFGLHGEVLSAVQASLADGSLDADLFERAVRRSLLTRFRLGEFDASRNPDFPYASLLNASAAALVVDCAEHRALARAAVTASAVLLRNVNATLPLALPPGAQLALIGPFADCQALDSARDVDSPLSCSYAHSYSGVTSAVSTLLSALREEEAAAAAAAAGGSSGAWSLAYEQGSNIVSALSGGGLQRAAALAASATATVLVLGLGSLVEEEGLDRGTLQLPAPQAALLQACAAAAAGAGRPAPILLLVSGGMVDAAFNATSAVLQLWYPGEEAGHGVADLLFGRAAPSARLPLTAHKEAYLQQLDPISDFDMVASSGVGRTYRYLGAGGGGNASRYINYPFGAGFGGYTSFLYANLSVALVQPAPGPGATPEAPLLAVTFTVTNRGSSSGGGGGGRASALAAAEVIQCYVAVPRDAAAAAAVGGAPIPLLGLAHFEKTAPLAPGASAAVAFALPLRAFQTTSLEGARVVTGGSYTVSVGGRMPGDDTGGGEGSNALQATVQLPAMS